MTDAIFEPGAIHAVFQPIVELSSGAVVGYEALARFDPSTGFDNPAAAFAAAAADPDRLARLDYTCINAAIDAALAAHLSPSTALFINVLPATLQRDTPVELQPAVRAATGRLRIVTEITEIDVTSRPAELVAFAARNRARGDELAIDDVGANRDSLSLLPLLAPDVIKLDRSIITEHPTQATGLTLGAVLAAAQNTGAAVLAEGIETSTDEQLAIGLGATYGQGWHYGRPGPLPKTAAADPARTLPFLDRADAVVPDTPFDLIEDHALQGRRAPYEYLLAISLDLEAKATVLDAPIVVSTFQDADRFTPATAARYQHLATSATLVGALADGLEPRPARGARRGHRPHRPAAPRLERRRARPPTSPPPSSPGTGPTAAPSVTAATTTPSPTTPAPSPSPPAASSTASPRATGHLRTTGNAGSNPPSPRRPRNSRSIENPFTAAAVRADDFAVIDLCDDGLVGLPRSGHPRLRGTPSLWATRRLQRLTDVPSGTPVWAVIHRDRVAPTSPPAPARSHAGIRLDRPSRNWRTSRTS